eukprot:jgi/Botrbrau1/19110/Bobra.0077s0023.1
MRDGAGGAGGTAAAEAAPVTATKKQQPAANGVVKEPLKPIKSTAALPDHVLGRRVSSKKEINASADANSAHAPGGPHGYRRQLRVRVLPPQLRTASRLTRCLWGPLWEQSNLTRIMTKLKRSWPKWRAGRTHSCPPKSAGDQSRGHGNDPARTRSSSTRPRGTRATWRKLP